LNASALVLPSAAFSEMDGTFTNGEGRIQQVNKAVDPPGLALPGWMILTRLAQAMGKPGFNYKRVSQVRQEIGRLVDSLSAFRRKTRKPIPLGAEAILKLSMQPPVAQAGEAWRLYSYPDENTYQGFPLATWVGGMQMLYDHQCVDIHPEDARQIGVSEQETLLISDETFELERAVRFCEDQPRGSLGMLLQTGVSHMNGLPISVTVRKKDV